MSLDFNALLQIIVDFFKLLQEFLNRLKGIDKGIEEIKPEENF